ncbi:hypothetical protein F5Y16DRAFT_355721 [Xylariaceae sp. FL0255]|nr:hypothetical protein F5Y16DRAFT_355721 [Xylariaceae sp. FL0255]
MLQAPSRSYICWRCAGRQLRSDVVFTRPSLVNRASSRRTLATVQHPNTAYKNSAQQASWPERFVPIRSRLQTWVEENKGNEVEPMLGDFPADGSLSNNLTRPQNVSMAHVVADESRPLFDGDELGDLRSDDATLSAGDLVELSSEHSRRPVLAVCLGTIGGYQHYYTSSGKWFSAMGIKTLFVVRDFVKADELQPVLAELPSGEVPYELLNTLRDLGEGPSRTAGASLLRKMLQFVQDAEAVYQANAGTLDASSSFIGDPLKPRFLTLHEIADKLLPAQDKIDNKFNPQSLYAVHRSLLQDEVFFRPLRQVGHRNSYLYEVSPLSEVSNINKVGRMVRRYLSCTGRPDDDQVGDNANSLYIETFIHAARKAIDRSRKHREWTKHGVLGPSSSSSLSHSDPKWSETDIVILEFIELWASYGKFPAYSHLQTYGSALLRALDRYQDAHGYTTATAWTFLQEIGWIPPWEIPARYSVRFPDVEIQRGAGYTRPYMGILERHLKRDTLSLIRKPLDGITAFCIDDISAREIDDAVSLERTEDPDQFWIHTHVADPASSIAPGTPLAKYAELIPEAIYLPGHMESMFPPEVIHDRFSLATKRPCLTFSALVRTNGSIIEEKITPHTLGDVVYMTYEDAAAVIGEVRQNSHKTGPTLSIGRFSKDIPPNRTMSRPMDLTARQKEDLAILSKLGTALQASRLERGATQYFQPRVVAKVTFDDIKQKKIKNFISSSGEPAIRIQYDHESSTDLVANAMKLANEVAARWCHQRRIPIPYRSQPHGIRNAAAVQQYARDVLNPMIEAGIAPSNDAWRQMRQLVGSDVVSTTPGPHFTLGVDMYTKATSPLRRFGDLIVHWQIEAALLAEHKTKTSLKSSDDSSLSLILPFNRQVLNRMLPMLNLREKQARALSNVEGTDQWVMQALVRAWKFREAPLPETFHMTVYHVLRERILGHLNWFNRQALLKVDALNDVARRTDIRLGDVIEVRLVDLNVHTGKIYVEALRMVQKANHHTTEEEIPPNGTPTVEEITVEP